jgi:hypothetical protein
VKNLSPVPFPFVKGCLMEKVNSLREIRSETKSELFGLMPSMLDKALIERCDYAKKEKPQFARNLQGRRFMN